MSVEWSGIRKIQTKQADDRADQPFGLPQRQAKHCPQGQSRRDRQCRIVRLTATGGPRLSPPRRDRLFGEPDRQATPLAQGSIIFRPICHPVLLSRNVESRPAELALNGTTGASDVRELETASYPRPAAGSN